MVEVTDEDRQAAASATVLVEMRELILSGRADLHAEPWAKHRQRGKLEGARLAIEAAASRADLIIATGRTEFALGYDAGAETAASAIRALSPAKIVGEG